MPAVLRLMGAAARATLGTGRLNHTGLTPNGHRFIANHRRLWLIESSHAVVDGVSVGPAGPLAKQASLGDLMLPQRGLFAVARVRLEQSVNRDAHARKPRWIVRVSRDPFPAPNSSGTRGRKVAGRGTDATTEIGGSRTADSVKAPSITDV